MHWEVLMKEWPPSDPGELFVSQRPQNNVSRRSRFVFDECAASEGPDDESDKEGDEEAMASFIDDDSDLFSVW